MKQFMHMSCLVVQTIFEAQQIGAQAKDKIPIDWDDYIHVLLDIQSEEMDTITSARIHKLIRVYI